MAIDIRSLFADILPDPAKEMEEKALTRSALLSKGMQGPLAGLAATMGYNSAQGAEGMRQGLNRMTGGGLSTASERLNQAAQNIDASTPQGQADLLAIVRRERGPGAAEQLREAFRQRNMQDIEVQQRNEQLRQGAVGLGIDQQNANTALLNAQTAYVNSLGRGASTSSAVSSAVEKLDPDQYDAGSFSRFQLRARELADAGDPDALAKAMPLLMPKAEDGWSYRPVQGTDGTTKYIQVPTGGKALQEAATEVRKWNQAADTAKRVAQDGVELIDSMFEQLDKSQTGIFGSIAKRIRGSETYTLATDMETVLARLGYDKLMEAKNNSATGASGFGQLTGRELSLLQSLVRALDVGLEEDELRERLGVIQEEFMRTRDTAYNGWTVEQWAGLEQPNMPTYTPQPREERPQPVDLSGYSEEELKKMLEEL